MTCATKIAMTTVEVWINCNSAPNCDIRFSISVALSNLVSQCHNLACKLVTGDDRVADQRRVAINNMQMAAADTTCTHSHEHFISTRSRVCHVHHPDPTRN